VDLPLRVVRISSAPGVAWRVKLRDELDALGLAAAQGGTGLPELEVAEAGLKE
jgi:hypothetical protein